MNNIFIPKEIHVGFQDRNNTYTGKLAYVIYKDEKGKLRKETSWNLWRDKDIDVLISENVPTEGFVLNKKAGGYSTGWNHRQTYTRVYDPRGFEFEITIENLLYILENTNSIKGKGLEGEFVYGWSGKDLILIPTSSPDYENITKLNELIHADNKIKAKDLKIGATYLTKQNEEWIFLGKYDYYDSEYSYIYEYKYDYRYYKKGKKFYFARYYENYKKEKDVSIEYITSVSGKLISVIDENCVSNFTELFNKLETKVCYSPIDYTKTEFIEYSKEFLEKEIEDRYLSLKCYVEHEGKYKYLKLYWTHDSKLVDGRRYEYYNHRLILADSEYHGKTIYGIFDNLDELLEKYKLCYRKLYLENGNFYSQDGGE